MEYIVEPRSWNYKIRLYGDVVAPENYVQLIEDLASATKEDTVEIYLNTNGGDGAAAISLVEAIRHTQATVTTIAEGMVASAGSLIFFAGHQHVVGDFCEVLLHDASGGIGGKMSEIAKHSESSRKTWGKFYHTIYDPYFSKKEIDKVLAGQDLWLTADELRGRLEKLYGEEE